MYFHHHSHKIPGVLGHIQSSRGQRSYSLARLWTKRFSKQQYLLDCVVRCHNNPLRPDLHRTPLRFCHKTEDICPVFEKLFLTPAGMEVVKDDGGVPLVVHVVAAPPLGKTFFVPTRVLVVHVGALASAGRPNQPEVVQRRQLGRGLLVLGSNLQMSAQNSAKKRTPAVICFSFIRLLSQCNLVRGPYSQRHCARHDIN